MPSLASSKPRLTLVFDPARNAVVKDRVPLCDDGHHCATPRSKHEVDGVTRAVCRFCGCDLMRMAASRRWFRCGEMGG
jgi:hypothetical protein